MRIRATDESGPQPTTILEVVVGSTVHGVAVQDGLEDLDLMAVVLEAAPQVLGFSPRDTWVTRTKPMGVRSEAGDVDYVAYGLRKFLQLALAGNPSLLLAFFVPDEHVRSITPEGAALRALAPSVISRQAHQPFLGYLRRQHERLLGLGGQRNVTRPELAAAYGYDTKFAAHAVRLGLQGEELLLTGRISLPMRDDDRALVLKVRTGGFALDEVSKLIDALALRLDAAQARSPLPERPDEAKVERWMIETYVAHWNRERGVLQGERMDAEVLFNVEEADEGGYVATAALHGIVTQADSIEELHAQVRGAVACHFDGADKPMLIRLHFVRDEVLVGEPVARSDDITPAQATELDRRLVQHQRDPSESGSVDELAARLDVR